MSAAPAEIRSDIAARLDRLPWGAFHWLLVTALGVTWVLDGLEVILMATVGNRLLEQSGLSLTEGQVGATGSTYLLGAIVGALVFGYLTDKLGRKKLFTLTLFVYMTGAVLTAFSWDFWSLAAFRALVGLGIGGEYAAINSAIDELIPARVRGRVDLAVNGTFWAGALLAAGLSSVLLDPAWVPAWLGWPLAFALGAALSLGMVFVRHYVPESPRWLMAHGRADEARKVMAEIEERASGGKPLEPVTQSQPVYAGVDLGFGTIIHTLLVRYRTRAALGLVLIVSQAFFYNGIQSSYPLTLKKFYHVEDEHVGGYFTVVALANLLGPLLLGHWFDAVGRRRMIAGTYALSGLAVVVAAWLFTQNQLTAWTHTAWWAATFFFASAAASAGYLTVSEIFPLEMRALAIALFYALGTLIGGAGAPWLFGRLVQGGRPGELAWGYYLGAGLMILAAAVEWFAGVDTEGKALEDVATPLTAEGRPPVAAGGN